MNAIITVIVIPQSCQFKTNLQLLSTGYQAGNKTIKKKN